jgi:hypothetical protein
VSFRQTSAKLRIVVAFKGSDDELDLFAFTHQ